MFDASPRSRLHRTTFVVLLSSLAACTATGDGAPAAGGREANELPAGWTRVVVADGGFSIGVPAVLAQDATYILSFMAPVASEAEYAPIFEQMAESFEEE